MDQPNPSNPNPTPNYQDSFESTLPVENSEDQQKDTARKRIFWLFIILCLIEVGFLAWEIVDLVLVLK